VVPGEWSGGELDYQAENVATMVANNASCNCNAAKLLVTWRGWPQRGVFLDRVSAALSGLPARRGYYPGSAKRHATFTSHPRARTLAGAAPDALPYATIYDVDPARAGDIVFQQEAWCPVVAETALDASDDAAFAEAAAPFCNDRVAGTLSAVVLASAPSQARLGDAFERMIAGLAYGTIAVNHWAAASYVLAVAPWGAYPGHTLQDVGSGIGVSQGVDVRGVLRPDHDVRLIDAARVHLGSKFHGFGDMVVEDLLALRVEVQAQPRNASLNGGDGDRSITGIHGGQERRHRESNDHGHEGSGNSSEESSVPSFGRDSDCNCCQAGTGQGHREAEQRRTADTRKREEPPFGLTECEPAPRKSAERNAGTKPLGERPGRSNPQGCPWQPRHQNRKQPEQSDEQRLHRGQRDPRDRTYEHTDPRKQRHQKSETSQVSVTEAGTKAQSAAPEVRQHTRQKSDPDGRQEPQRAGWEPCEDQESTCGRVQRT